MVSPILPHTTPPSLPFLDSSQLTPRLAGQGTVSLMCYCVRVCLRGKATEECRLLRGPSGKAVGQFSQLLGERATAGLVSETLPDGAISKQ